MKAIHAVLLALAAITSARFASAQPVPSAAPIEPAWAVTGTSSVAVPEPVVTHRVERRQLEKDDRLIARAGLSYLSRGDFYTNPGVSIEVAYHPREELALDLVSATVFFSKLGSTAHALRTSTGLLPDSQRPYARVATGARYAFAYGKLLLETLDVVVHIDASAAAHAGVLITDHAPNVGGDVGLALEALAGPKVLIFVEALWWISYERRETTRFASGPLGTLGFGYLF